MLFCTSWGIEWYHKLKHRHRNLHFGALADLELFIKNKTTCNRHTLQMQNKCISEPPNELQSFAMSFLLIIFTSKVKSSEQNYLVLRWFYM